MLSLLYKMGVIGEFNATSYTNYFLNNNKNLKKN